ncbi:hypothetical protein FGO68_gene3133 [Halteria grandinella]|uniref:Uncharacterized protein n=1 Tax=Halteria grandinella TaxID=5974 RepID=A0A8J8NNG0_HALGN|nr:hypothetical protein FGO68_gene3133 [Halteria grandinella]
MYIKMESTKYTLTRLVKNNKAMLSQEFFPFLTQEDLGKFLFLSKVTNQWVLHIISIDLSYERALQLLCDGQKTISIVDLSMIIRQISNGRKKQAAQEEQADNSEHFSFRELLQTDGKLLRSFFQNQYIRYSKEKRVMEILTYAGDLWEWKGDKRYWGMREIKSSNFLIYEQRTNYLKDVCLFDPYVQTLSVRPGYKYKLYILHGVEESSKIENEATITVELIPQYQKNPTREDSTSNQAIFKDDFISTTVFQTMPRNEVVDTYLCDVDLTQQTGRDQSILYTVKIQLNNKDLWWKRGWFFDGMKLVPNGLLNYPTAEEVSNEGRPNIPNQSKIE